MAIRKKRTVRRSRKSGGHPFLLVLFFLCLITGSSYMADHLTNGPDTSMNVAAVRHIFNDKEKQGLVPKEDQGTPESVKEKIKAALNQMIVVETRAEDEKTLVAKNEKEEAPLEVSQIAIKPSEAKTEDLKTEEPKAEEKKAEEKEETKLFDLGRVFSSDVKEKAEEKAVAEETLTKPAEEAAVSHSQPVEKSTVAVKKEASTVVKKNTAAPAKTESPAPKAEAPKVAAAKPAEPAKAKKEAAPSKPVVSETPKAQTAKAAASVTGRLVVVIDDAGRDLESQKVYENMGIPLTLAVMPNQVHTREAALSWHAHGLPLILHQPMESVSGIGMEQKVILTSMSDGEIRQLLKESLAQVPEAIGINNHQGSKATTNQRAMEVVMNELHHRGLFFFDSHTNSTTAADAAARTYGVRYAKNDLFVDNSADVGDICRMIREGAERAKKNGTYIIIGHCRPHTAEAFRQMVPKLKAEGIEFVYLSAVEK